MPEPMSRWPPPREGRTPLLVLETARLRVTALSREALQAWVDGDGRGLLAETGVVFAEPPACPPLFGEDLPRFRDRMAETPHELGWWVWVVSRREDRRAVGVCGLGGRPDGEGTVVLGYSVYAEVEGRGYATEAAAAVLAWAMGHPEVARVRALVPEGHAASAAVARKLGMALAGRDQDPEAGEVLVFEATSGDSPAGHAWPERVHGALRAAGVALVGYIPAAGCERLIELCRADPGVRAVCLGSGREGVALAADARARAERCALLLPAPAVRGLAGPAPALQARFPLVLLVAERDGERAGDRGEGGPGEEAGARLEDMGAHVVRAEVADAVPLAVSAALDRAWAADTLEAVLISARILGET